MKQIAFLCSEVTITGSPNRRSDAFEHDRTVAALRPEFEKLNLRLTEVSWDDATANWDQFDAVVIGTTWDYWDRSGLFLETLDQIQSKTCLWNSASLVRWNSNKSYLKQFAGSDIGLIPTVWIDSPNQISVEQSFTSLACEEIVLKRQVGAGAEGQYRLRVGDPIPSLTHPMMAQPYLPSIETEGELSLIFIDGQFSHGVVKHAAAGDYRIQSSYGGTEEAINPTEADKSAAAKVIESLEETPLYARVDMLRDDSGELYLMELELIEPYLYPIEGPDLGRLMAEALVRRLA